MWTLHKKTVVALFITGLFLSPQSFATSIKKMDLAEMSTMADSIIVGRCTSVKTEWVGNKIFTKSTIQINDHIKGDGNNSIDITSIGGTAIHPTLKVPVTMSVGGGLSFKLDEEVVLFTKSRPGGINQVIGMSMGKFEVRTDKSTGKKHVPFSQKILDVMPPGTFTPKERKDGRRVDKTLKPRDLDLDEFITKIREHVRKK